MVGEKKVEGGKGRGIRTVVLAAAVAQRGLEEGTRGIGAKGTRGLGRGG
jgi:hypothetical protein